MDNIKSLKNHRAARAKFIHTASKTLIIKENIFPKPPNKTFKGQYFSGYSV